MKQGIVYPRRSVNHHFFPFRQAWYLASPESRRTGFGKESRLTATAPLANIRREPLLTNNAVGDRLDSFGIVGSAVSVPDVVEVGPLKLCRPTVVSAFIGPDQYTGQAVLNVRLNDQAKATFAQITKRAINSVLPVKLNGKVLASPRVVLEITGGEFYITIPKKSVLERVNLALSNDC